MLKKLLLAAVLSVMVACGTSDGNQDSGSQGAATFNPALCAGLSNCIAEDQTLMKLFGMGSFGDMCSALEFPFSKDYNYTDYKISKFIYSSLRNYGGKCSALLAPFTLSQEEQDLCQSKNGTGSYCQGDKLVDCDTKMKVACPDMGLKCMDNKDNTGHAMCYEDTCSDNNKVSCLDTHIVKRCDANGRLKYIDCSIYETVFMSEGGDNSQTSMVESLGGVCNTDADDMEDQICIGTGKECDKDSFQAYCDGDKIITCKGEHVTTGDCSLKGLKCIQTANTVMCGRGSECSMEDKDSCTNGVIKFCDYGIWREVDCKAAGFTGCDKSGDFYFCKK